MGFLAGRISYERFRVLNVDVRQFGEEHLQTLEKFSIDQAAVTGLDEPAVGFLAGKHLLDLNFSLEKNILGDVLHCGVRIDVNKIPPALKKAWLAMELAAAGADNDSGRPNKEQRRQANEAVEARCEAAAGSGHFRRMQHFPVLWDAREGMLYIGSSSPTAIEQCVGLFERAFELQLERVTAGRLAEQWAADSKKKTSLEDIAPSAFLSDGADAPVAWIKGVSQNLDFLGNEFLLWLWWTLETKSDEIALADDSEVVGMLNRTLTLECPRAESGKETITSEAPVRLPEARLAIGAGKLPRKSGLVLVRHGVQYEFVLQAESFAVSGAKSQIASTGNASGSGDEDDRVEALRSLAETIDLLFGAFCKRRLAKGWAGDLAEMRHWLGADVARRSAA